MTLNICSINVDDAAYRLFINIAITVISFVGFWFIPEILFSKLLVWRRDKYFNKLLSHSETSINDDEFRIDWNAIKIFKK